MNFKILHINDLHSRFEELAKIATAIDDLRDESTLLFDAGDNSDLWRIETIGTKGEISSVLLNELRFNARIIGNTEGFSGADILNHFVKASKVPFITCNIYEKNEKKVKNVKDFLILKVKNIRLLLIGVTPAYNEFYSLLDLYIKDPTEEIKRVLSELDRTSYDLVVIISHLGLKGDKDLANTNLEIDIIIGGHSHSILNQCIFENHTIICQAGHYGQYLGELVIEYDNIEKKITNYESRLIDVKDYPDDLKILDIIAHNSKIAHKNLNEPLYQIEEPLNHSLTEENEIGNLLADALRDFLDCDLGIINSGVLNHGLDKGSVTKLKLHEICPSPLNPTLMLVKGRDILISLEKSLLSEYQKKDGSGAGFRGEFLGNLQVSENVRIEYQTWGETLNKIISITIDGQPLILNHWYKVGTSDYLQRGTGYTELANNKNISYNKEWLRDLLEIYINNKNFRTQAKNIRFIVIKNGKETVK